MGKKSDKKDTKDEKKVKKSKSKSSLAVQDAKVRIYLCTVDNIFI